MGVAALITFGGCGDDSDDTEAFCEEGALAYGSFDEWIGSGELSRDDLDHVVDAMDAADPPSEISEEWTSVVDALEGLRDSDPGDPTAVAQAQEGVLQLGEPMGQLDSYFRGAC